MSKIISKKNILAATALLLITGCAAGHNPSVDVPSSEGCLAGFWLGLWHGFIILFTFIGSLFTESISVYEVHNTGGWYDFGFFLGIIIAISNSESTLSS